MTFYNLHNSVKSTPKMQEMAFQGPPRGLLACFSLPSLLASVLLRKKSSTLK